MIEGILLTTSFKEIHIYVTLIFYFHLTAVPLKWASRSLKQLKHSLLEEVFHVRRFESVILQPINGLLYEQKQICVRTIG